MDTAQIGERRSFACSSAEIRVHQRSRSLLCPHPGRHSFMSDSARARANFEQRRAADPRASAFVAASAGSGKTKLLTDRLLRLMLSEPPVPPQRIQCLTCTKAAAAEMSVRLQNTLGEWVTLRDAALDAELATLDIFPADEV